MRSDNDANVTYVKRRRGGRKKHVRVGALTTMMTALEAREGWYFQARHVRGVNTRLADGMTRWKVERIPERLNAESTILAWQVQDLGDEERQMC